MAESIPASKNFCDVILAATASKGSTPTEGFGNLLRTGMGSKVIIGDEKGSQPPATHVFLLQDVIEFAILTAGGIDRNDRRRLTQ